MHCPTCPTDRQDRYGAIITPPQVNEMSEAEIDSTLADSFPASDPPSWTLGSDHASVQKISKLEVMVHSSSVNPPEPQKSKAK
jgi:hypothetical protein